MPSFWPDIADVVSGALAVIAAAISVVSYLRIRARDTWWRRLQPLLVHLRDAAIAHPYRFSDGYLPVLTDVYVERRVVPRTAVGGPDADRAMAADALLTQSRDVVLIGEPGSGKTAYLWHAMAESARSWLARPGRLRHRAAGPVVVALPAAALIHDSVPSALAAAYHAVAPAVDFSRRPAPGRQWLVCVDGVSAVADSDDRSVVLGRLATLHQSADRTDQPWRILVTTRQLAETELAALGAEYTAYHLEPFNQDDVDGFALRWFEAKSDGWPAATAAAAFRDWLRENRLADLAGNPLTVTVAARVWEFSAAEPVAGPAALLRRFVGQLIASGRGVLDDACAELHRHPPTGPLIAAWLTEHHLALIEHAAGASVHGTDVVAAAVDWSAAQAPAPPAGIVADWPDRVRQLLLACGLFRADRTALRPIWPSLVDYLAAAPLARSWNEEHWVAAMNHTSQRGLGVHAYTRAAVEPGFLRSVSAGRPGLLAAGHLLAAGAAVEPKTAEHIIAALLARWVSGAEPSDPGSPASGDASGECLSLLLTLTASRDHRVTLRRIALDPHRPSRAREAVALLFAVRQNGRLT